MEGMCESSPAALERHLICKFCGGGDDDGDGSRTLSHDRTSSRQPSPWRPSSRRTRSSSRHPPAWSVRTSGVLAGTLVLLMLCGLACAGRLYRVPLYRTSKLVSEAEVQALTALSPAQQLRRQEDNLHGKPGQGYYIEMQIGQPPQKLNVLVDTGSSNFAVAAAPHADVETFFNASLSATFEDRGVSVSVPYTQGNWHGRLGRDVVIVSSLPGVHVTANLACIMSSTNFFINGSHWQGILGLAFSGIARPDSSVEPFFDSLISQTEVNNTFSMQLCGTVPGANSDFVSMGGTMILGGVDPSLYSGDLLYVPLYKEWYYEVVITDITVDGNSLNLDCKEYNFDKSIVDSGTTNLRLPTKVYHKVVRSIQQHTHMVDQVIPAMFWSGADFLCWPVNKTSWWASFPTLEVSLAQSNSSVITLVITPQQYLRAIHDVLLLTDTTRDCYKFAVSPSETGTVLGAVVMEGYYVVFDRQNKQVGFGKSTCSNLLAEGHVQPEVKGPLVSGNTGDCAYQKPSSGQSPLITVAYVMAGICGACIVPLLLMVVQWQWQRCRKREQEVCDISSLLKDDESSEATTTTAASR